MGRSGAARAAESAAFVLSARAPRSPAPRADASRKSKCAPSALAATVRRRAARARRLQTAGLCARARRVCARAPVACVLTKVCLLNPLPGCALYPEPQHPRAWSGISAERPLGPVQVPQLRAGGRAGFSARGAEEARGRGGSGQLETRVAQLRDRFRALCAFPDTLAGSVSETERTRGSGLNAPQPRGAAELVLFFSALVCKSELENSRLTQPPPSSPAPQLGLGVGGAPPG